jgi:hypothetical protein
MPEICRFYGIIIRMYFKDHNPPHFHAEYQNFKAEYSIKSLDTISGKLPVRAHALVLEWASIHRDELMENWKKIKIPEAPKTIEPLN